MALTERENKLLLFFVGFLVFVACFWKVLPPIKQKIDVEKKTIEELKGLKEKIQDKTQFETMYKLYRENDYFFKKFRFIALSQPEMLQYAALIEGATKGGKVQITSLAFGKAEKAEEGNFGKMPIIIAGKGDYFGIKEFLMELEKTLPLMSVQNLGISPFGGAQDVYSFNINLLTYTLAWPQETKAPSQEAPNKAQEE
jgi:hypothetical protein